MNAGPQHKIFWKLPPTIKVYEALGCIADGRMEADGNTAKVFSSSRNKYYTVMYDPDQNAIMANDNGSYWQGYVGYPAIALLMQKGVLPFDPKVSQALGGIAWKDVNTAFKNNYTKTEQYVAEKAAAHGVTADDLRRYAEKALHALSALRLQRLGDQTRPPEGY